MTIKAIWSGKINIKIVSFLWLIALARLIMPITFEAPLHFDSLLPEVIENTEMEQLAINENRDTAADTNNGFSGFTQPVSSDYTNLANEKETSTADEPTFVEKSIKYIKGMSLWSWAFIMWIVGCIYILARSVFLGIKFNRKVSRTAYTKNQDLNALLDEAKKYVNIKSEITIFQSIHVDVPVVFGAFKPKIIIPTRLYLSVKRDKLKLIILHELCHIKRRDILANILWLIAKAIHWFNPMVWIAYNMYLDDVELSCDDMVIGKVSKSEGFEYSQSLLDVIKLSKNIQRLPIALSFCEDKGKLRKRVMNMIKPKKKLKSAGVISMLLAVIMIVTCFTTACQPTPEKEVVQNKNDGQLEEAILETAAPVSESAQSTEEPAQGVRIVDSLSNDTETIGINIDAKVVPEGDEKITVARLETYNFQEQEMDRIVNIFFGGNVTYYDHLITTKSVIEEHIVRLQHRLTFSDEELLAWYADRDMTDVGEIKAHLNSIIEVHKEDAAKAPETAPVIEKFESRSEEWGGFYADVDFGKDYMGYVSYDEPFAGRTSFYCSVFKDEYAESMRGTRIYSTIKTDVDTTSSEFAEAKQNAQSLIDEIGIEGVELGDVHISICSATNGGETIADGKEFYVFCFERIVGDRTIDYSFYDGGYTDDYEVTQTVPYEKIEVWTDGTEVVKFFWQNPHRVTGIVNDNTAVQIDYMQALQLAINQIYAKYAYVLDNGQATNVEVNITGLEFEMVRMKEKNTDNYISVPAWKIYGEAQMKRSQAELDYLTKYVNENDDPYIDVDGIDLSEWISMTSMFGPNIVTVNALDGSIINMDDGY